VLSRLLKVFLVSTALAPVFLTLAFVEWRQRTFLPWGASYLSIAIFMTAGCLVLLKGAQRNLEVLTFTVTSASTADREVIGFLLAYVLPLLLSRTTATAPDAGSVIFIVLLFGLVVWGTHSYDFNPVLGAFGYHFYKVATPGGINYVLITRRQLVSVQEINKVVQLTEYVVLDTE
jgi:hypothetical protein